MTGCQTLPSVFVPPLFGSYSTVISVVGAPASSAAPPSSKALRVPSAPPMIAACGGVSTAGRARDWAAALLAAAPDDVVRGFVTELAVEPLQMSGEPDEKYADVVLARVGELAAGRQIAGIKAKLQRMNPEEDQAAYNKMFGDLVGLEQRRKWLLDRATGS